MQNGACLWCEGKNLVEGSLTSTGHVYFKASNAKFWTLSENMVGVKARVCTDCGYIDLYADTAKLRKLVRT